jgi:hypothetical protein
LLCAGLKMYENVLTEYCSMDSSRKAEDLSPAEFVTEYLRMYVPGRQVPNVSSVTIHLHA